MASSDLMENCSSAGGSSGFLLDMMLEEMWKPFDKAADYFVYQPWLFSLLGSTMVGLAGIFPLLVIPIDEGADLKNGASAGTLKILLSFAVGGLLGDVFLHLLPEAWGNELLKEANSDSHPSMVCGLWVLSGFLVFIIIEKIFAFEANEVDAQDPSDNSLKNERQVVGSEELRKTQKEMENNNCINVIGDNPKNGFSKLCLSKPDFLKNPVGADLYLQRKTEKTNGYVEVANGLKSCGKNGFVKTASIEHRNGSLRSTDATQNCVNGVSKSNGYSKKLPSNGYVGGEYKTCYDDYQSPNVVAKVKSKHITGYLNLMANCIDNFTHGLAVGGSFLVSFRLGALTTFAILIHEIPHEVGDFAILLQSGFSRWDAARAQILTASGGIFGALAAVLCSGGAVEAKTSWILPFTAGGFLHIGLVTILPELLKETDAKESLKQLGSFLFGVILMAALTILCD